MTVIAEQAGHTSDVKSLNTAQSGAKRSVGGQGASAKFSDGDGAQQVISGVGRAQSGEPVHVLLKGVSAGEGERESQTVVAASRSGQALESVPIPIN